MTLISVIYLNNFMNKQKILNFEKINDFSYDNFFVSKSNFLAHKTLININQRERFIFLKG